jgi:pseudouridine synthase
MTRPGDTTRPPETHDFTDPSRGPRLQRILADAGIGSRRACEELIEAGEVAVNGHVVKRLPAWADARSDRITVHGRRLRPAEPLVYVMLFKPRGVECTNAPEAGAGAARRRAIDLVKHPTLARLYPVGRLDVESSGLLLLTNDGPLANRLTHPRYAVHKTYEVTVEGALDEEAVARLEKGVFLPQRRAGRPATGARRASSRLRLVKRHRDRTILEMDLREGRNRQVRRMMLLVGHKVRKLRRVRLGPLALTGLRPGQWRDLTREEVGKLRRAAWKS